MFGAFYFGEPMFGQGLISGLGVLVSTSLRWLLHRFDMRPRVEETR